MNDQEQNREDFEKPWQTICGVILFALGIIAGWIVTCS